MLLWHSSGRFLWIRVCISLAFIPRDGSAGPGTVRQFSKLLCHFTFPPAMCEGSYFSLSSSILTIVCCFYSKYLSGYLLSHCTFDLIFLMTSVVEHIFMCCLYNFLGKMSIQSLWPFFSWVMYIFYYCVVVFTYYRHKSFARYTICKYLPSFYVLTFHFLD